MGGKTFPDLNVPRMSPELYKSVSAECLSKLASIFDRVVVPRDAPNKTDYGDIDYLVQGHQFPMTEVWDHVETALCARFRKQNGCTTSFAIPHPELSGAYLQIDVELCFGDGTSDGPALFEWTRLIKGDADLMQIIGVSHRALGLRCTNQGLYVCIEDIFPDNKEKAKLFLTRDPNEALKFYGLDMTKYWAGFGDETELFEWVSGGRFFSPEVFERRLEKSNDRSRQAKRPMYARFVEQYMPTHADKKSDKIWTRQEVLEEALKTFDKQAVHDAMIAEHQLKMDEDALWQQISTMLPTQRDKSTKFAKKSLRRWVMFENGQPVMAPTANLGTPLIWTQAMAAGSRNSVLAWVMEHWEEAKVLEKARAGN